VTQKGKTKGHAADWMSITLHALLGLVVGTIFGAEVAFHSGLFVPSIIVCIPGAALMGAGLGAQLGDKLWIGNSYSIIPPDGIRHSGASRVFTYGLIGLGFLLIAAAIIFEIWFSGTR
jgi:hypothetical protein